MDILYSYSKFKQNKYFMWYIDIIRKSLYEKREYDPQKYEYHHIIPKALGGADNIENIVILSFREHYLCHEMLVRFTSGIDKMKMCFALHTFFHFDYHRPSVKRSILYETHRNLFREICKTRIPHTKPDVFVFKNCKTGRIIKGTRKEIKDQTNLSSQEIYNLLSNGFYEKKRWHSKEWGVFVDDLQCFSYEIPRPKNKQSLVECEHCKLRLNPGNYKRWHGPKCSIVDPKGHELRTTHAKTLRAIQLVSFVKSPL